MPIYAYRCASCGHEKDVLQKMSDAPLTQCPACGQATFSKQVTAAGFQLKGSGWYVTDFRGGNNGGKAKDAAAPAKSENGSSDAPAASSEAGSSSNANASNDAGAKASSSEASKPASSTPSSGTSTSGAA
ncbi:MULTISPECIES: FmdB family zinc ribbon protein [unclassified Caballeronia]|uniref:FmdB family zinc ribbon protein n=1 Tax=unclassified Caballeronia TaxID=2646786 RepID=UPI002027C104|nr:MULTISPECIES: FmdB family zinc ribbon protein [unclassified Caballeronia]